MGGRRKSGGVGAPVFGAYTCGIKGPPPKRLVWQVFQHVLYGQ